MAIINPTEEQLNEWLSQQTLRGGFSTPNRLADLVNEPVPMNSFRNNSTGRTVTLPSIQEQGGMSLDDLLAKTGATMKDKVDVQGYGPGFRLRGGGYAGLDRNGKMWELRPALSAADQLAQLNLQMKQRQLEGLDLENQTKRAALKGGSKPQFVDGQWVYPPSQDAPMGRAVKVEGFSKAEKPPTDEQSKAGGFGVRAATSHEILNYVGNDGKVQPGKIKRSLEAVPFVGESLGTLTNWTQSAGQQQIEQAQRDFVNAILRRESGAVISPSEFENAAKQYFPQPGDSPAVIQQKKMNRENSIASLETSAGPVAPKVKSARQKMQTIFEAHKAIKGGADREAVRARLEEMGINDHGL